MAGGSPAATAGIKDGDVLIRVGDTAITDAESLLGALSTAVDTEVPIELIRWGRRETLSVTPIAHPKAKRRCRG